jgi:hypothetical protein
VSREAAGEAKPQLVELPPERFAEADGGELERRAAGGRRQAPRPRLEPSP